MVPLRLSSLLLVTATLWLLSAEASYAADPQLQTHLLPPPWSAEKNGYFMGFYGVGQYVNETAGWTNAYYSASPSALVRSRALYPNATKQLMQLEYWFLTTGKREGSPAIVLVPNWKALWTDTVAPIASELLSNGTIVGFFLGDELMWNGFAYDDLVMWSNTIRETFPNAWIWENEATPVYACDPSKPSPGGCAQHPYTGCCDYYNRIVNITAGIPPALSATSIDMYNWMPRTTPWVPQVRKYYEQYLYPRAHKGQTFFVVPGSAASTRSAACNFDCYESICDEDAKGYLKWVLEDSRLSGMVPWTWKSCGAGCDAIHDEIGTRHMPRTKQTYATVVGPALVGYGK